VVIANHRPSNFLSSITSSNPLLHLNARGPPAFVGLLEGKRLLDSDPVAPESSEASHLEEVMEPGFGAIATTGLFCCVPAR
jgi:hypothetical protein